MGREIKKQKHLQPNYQSYTNNYTHKPSHMEQVTYAVQQYGYY